MTKVTSTFGGIGLGPNASGTFNIGGTNDILYGGDMSGDAAGLGVTLLGTGGSQQFAFSVFGEDGGTAIASGWASTGFFSYVNYAAQATGSAFALTGQTHIGANLTACDNVAGVYGVAECDSAVTASAHVYGGLFAISVSAGTFSANYVVSSIALSARQSGATTSGLVSGIHFKGGTGQGMDVAMYFGTGFNVDVTGCGADLTADASEDILGHIHVKVGSTLGYVNVYSDAT